MLDTMKYPIFDYWYWNLWQIYFLALISRPLCVIHMLLKYKCTFFMFECFRMKILWTWSRLESEWKQCISITLTVPSLMTTFNVPSWSWSQLSPVYRHRNSGSLANGWGRLDPETMVLFAHARLGLHIGLHAQISLVQHFSLTCSD